MKIDGTEYPFEFGKEAWKAGETVKPGPYLVQSKTRHVGLPPYKVSSSYSWKDEQTLSLILRYVEGPHHEDITLRFEGEKLSATFINSFGKVELTGKLKN
jgi:hypothetical protein